MTWLPYIKSIVEESAPVSVAVDGVTITGTGESGTPLTTISKSRAAVYDGVLAISNGTGFWSDTGNLGQGARARVTYLSVVPDGNGRYPIELEFMSIAWNINSVYTDGNFQVLFDSNAWLPLPDETSPNEPCGVLGGSVAQGPAPFDTPSVAILNGHVVRNGGTGAAAGFVAHCRSNANTASGNKILSMTKIMYDTQEAP